MGQENETIMKVYIVEGSSGTYDDYGKFLIGVYDNPQKADEAKQLHLAKVLKYRTKYSDQQIESFDEQIEELFEKKVPDDNWPKDIESYWQWKYDGPLSVNNWAAVTEVEMNEMQYWK